jgi:hypothetical protein
VKRFLQLTQAAGLAGKCLNRNMGVTCLLMAKGKNFMFPLFPHIPRIIHAHADLAFF